MTKSSILVMHSMELQSTNLESEKAVAPNEQGVGSYKCSTFDNYDGAISDEIRDEKHER
jgi:hypothetical protein